MYILKIKRPDETNDEVSAVVVCALLTWSCGRDSSSGSVDGLRVGQMFNRLRGDAAAVSSNEPTSASYHSTKTSPRYWPSWQSYIFVHPGRTRTVECKPPPTLTIPRPYRLLIRYSQR